MWLFYRLENMRIYYTFQYHLTVWFTYSEQEGRQMEETKFSKWFNCIYIPQSLPNSTWNENISKKL